MSEPETSYSLIQALWTNVYDVPLSDAHQNAQYRRRRADGRRNEDHSVILSMNKWTESRNGPASDARRNAGPSEI